MSCNLHQLMGTGSQVAVHRTGFSSYALEYDIDLLGIFQALREPQEFAEVPWNAEMGGESQLRLNFQCKHQDSWSSKCYPTLAVS